ncbi:MAG: glucosaminidase domain-containing protein [Pseudomonadota bacterium]
MTPSVTDFEQFTSLRTGAERNDPAVLREVAGQFEALFIESLLKNMREASLGDPLLGDSHSHEMYQGLMDQQLSVQMASGRGIGLADMLVRQLGGSSPITPAKVASTWADARDFVREAWPHAKRAAKRLDVSPVAVMAQAALETGWGQHVPGQPNGDSSFNVFGIKAGKSWKGAAVAKPTLEIEDGLPRREVAKFRAYKNMAASFDDYANLLTRNSRYADVSGHRDNVRAFGQALQSGGYSTDPAYAEKLARIAASPTMRDALNSIRRD